MQARGEPPPLPGTPAPANPGPQIIFTAPGNFVSPPGTDQAGQPLPPGTASIDGTVTISGTSDPIPGAVVEIRKTDCGKTGGESMTATSGPDGKFSFKLVRAGSWCIGAAKAGGAFSPVEYQQRGYKSRGLAIPIADNQQIQDIKLMMPRTGSISGRVFDSDGEPMGHARVQAMEAFYESGQRRLYTLNAVQTNDLGEFSLFWLPPGDYYVSAVPEDPLRQNVTFSVSPPGIGGHRSDAMPTVISRKNLPDGSLSEEVYAPVYFGGGPDPQRAQKITVAPGSSNSIELSFAGARTGSFHVRGRAVNGTTGQPADSAQIRLYPQNWTATAVVPYARVDKNGNFDIAGVAPGSYALYASSSTRDPNATNPTTIQGLSPEQIQQLLSQGVNLGGTIPIGARIPVEMGNQNIEGISVNLLPGGTLNGEFIFEGNLVSTLTPQQKSSFRVNLSRQPDIPGATLGGASTGAIAPNATDNSFRMPSIFPGDFRVLVSPLINAFSWTPQTLADPLTNMYVKSARYGNQDVLGGGLHLDTHSPDQRLQITLATGGGLQGVVLSSRNEPMSNVKVALIPNSGNPNREDLYRNAVTDASGRFKIQGIAAGDYRVFAWEDIADGAWEDADVLRAADARGKTVHINDGEQSSVEVFANPGGRQ
jgi:5-hydroxyisourate hydrolase-like protein (transthyretin family)